MEKRCIYRLAWLLVGVLLLSCPISCANASESEHIEIADGRFDGLEHGFYNYSFIVKNCTDRIINTISLDVVLMDADGNIIDSSHPQESSRVRPGQSITISSLSKANTGAVSAIVDGYSYYQGDEYVRGYIDNSPVISFSTNAPSADVRDSNSGDNGLNQESALSEIEPFLSDVGLISNNRSDLPDFDTIYSYDIHIAGIPGKMQYGRRSFGDVAYYSDDLTWTSEKEYEIAFDDYSKVRDLIAEYYGITDDYNKESGYFECRNDAFSRIKCEYRYGNQIVLCWEYNRDNYNKQMLAGLAATNDLRNILKNPNSLQVHEIAYAKYAFCSEYEGAIGIRIDYSAQNGFGGYNRDYYYAFINPVSGEKVETIFDPSISLAGSTFLSLNVTAVSSARRNVDMKAPAILVHDTELNLIDDYLSLLDMTFAEIGLSEKDASNTMGTRFSLDNAVFLGEKTTVYLWFDEITSGSSMPSLIEVGPPVSVRAPEQLKKEIVEEFDCQISKEDEYSFAADIPDKRIQIEAHYAVSRSLYIVPMNTTDAAATAPPLSDIEYSELKSGAKGEAVVQLQERLEELGYYTISIDGDYGRGTSSAVEEFQRVNDLPITGIASSETQAVLYSDDAKKKSESVKKKSGTTVRGSGSFVGF